jgi:branched-chain amino acid transport system permease protein
VLSEYWLSILTFAGINSLMALSLYMPMSAGLISLGQGGFMAIGAYSSASLTKSGVPFSIALVGGALISAFIGLLVGAPALRIRGMYLMILTIGFGEIVRIFFLNFDPTGGASGLGGIFPYTTPGAVLIACLAALALIVFLRNAHFGRALVAVHEDDVAAEAVGINLMRVKLTAFGLGAFFAGIAGGFYAHEALFIDANQFDFARSATAFLYVALGGPANPFGPIVGAVFVTLVPEVLRFVQDWRMTFFGLLLVAIAIWRPGGLIPGRGLRAR